MKRLSIPEHPDTMPNDVDNYAAGFPGEIQETLARLRMTIKKAAPGAEEILSYRMPAYRLHGILVYFAVHKNHIGFYPTASGIAAFQSELSEFRWTKGTVQFPHGKKIPFKLIERIVRHRVKENASKHKITGGHKS